MSEEEKKAIDFIKEVIELWLDKDKSYVFGTDYEKENLKTILNLIEKQQKEIEDLKAITQNYNAIGGETFGDDIIIVCSMKYFDDGYFKKNYIFKEKIRELIENNQDDIDYSIHDIIKDLKELLGE